MKIIKLQAENFKRLRAVEIEPDGSLVVINGQNGAGKSSVLDAIEAGLGGKRSIPGVPIRKGKKRAKVVIELEDMTITCKFTSKGSSITVVAKSGASFKSPQTMLDRLVGTLSFDPLGFSRQDAKTQQETLRGIVGLNFAEHDMKRNGIYQERRDVNRDVKRVEAHLDQLPHNDDAPAEGVSVSGLLAEVTRRREHNGDVAYQQEKLDVCVANRDSAAKDVGRLEGELAEVRAALVRFEKAEADQRTHAGGLQEQPTDEIEAQIAGAEEANRKRTQNAEHARVSDDLATATSKATSLTDQIDELDAAKAKTIHDAEFPVEGLGFDEDGVTFEGLPLSQASGAERLKVSVAIGMKLNPDLRVLLIRDGSLLDGDNLTVLQEMATDDDFQIWLERVGDDGEIGILIEDGQVIERDEAAE
jgi:hypothetical protein